MCLENFAQQVSSPSTFLFQRLTVENGLSQASNKFIYKDTKGFVWISSTSGLNRYDGYQVRIYREDDNDKHSIRGANINGVFCESPNTDLWFSTPNAVNHYQRASDNFEYFAITDTAGTEQSGYFTCGLDKQGLLWLIHAAAVYTFNTSTKKFNYVCEVNPRYQNAKAVFSKTGVLKYLFVFYGGSVSGSQVIKFSKYNKQETVLLFSKKNTSSNYPNLKIRDVHPENDTLIYLASNKGIIAFNPESESYDIHPLSNDNIQEGKPLDIKAIESFDDNYLIVGTYHGFCFFNKKEKSFSKFQSKTNSSNYSLISNLISNIYTDAQQGLWMDIPGVSVEYTFPPKIKFKNFLTFNELGKKANFRKLINLSDGNIWAGTFSEINFILNQNLEIIKKIDSKSHPILKGNNLFYHFEDSSKRVWLLGWGGAGYYNLIDKNIYPVFSLEKKQPTFIFGKTLQDSTILFSALEGGFFELRMSALGQPYFSPFKSVANDDAYPIFYQSEDGTIYANRDLNELVVFDKNLKELHAIPIKADFRCFYEASNDSLLWIGTDRGLLRYNKINHSYRFFTENDGLPNALIFGMVAKKNNLWLSTSAGIAKFNRDDFSIKSFNTFDGIAFLEFNGHSYLKKQDGQILFGSLNGLTTFYPDEIKPIIYTKSPQITSIKINDESLHALECKSTGATNISEIKNIELDHDSNTISFEFSAMDYGDPKNNLYKYRMTNKNKEQPWIESGTRNFARFANIESGHHEFQLLAANSDGDWSKEPVILGIYIIPPLLERTWFRILLGAIFLGLFWLGSRVYYQIKFGKKIALERQKTFWARKMHEDLGADYSSLKMRIGMLFSQLKPQENLQKDTTRISDLTETVSTQIRGITWALNHKNDRLDKLVEHLHNHASNTFEDTGIDLHFPLSDHLPQKMITGENRMTILHVFKEAINNILKHSEASQVKIRISYTEDYASILIEDNGKGFDPKLLLQSSGNGLTNIRERMQEIAGDAAIKTNERGTSVDLSFPI